MSKIPYISVVIEGGLVQTTLIERWPDQLPLPRIVVVDYDKDGADETEFTEFAIGNEVVEALCHVEVPGVYESFHKRSTCARSRWIDASPLTDRYFAVLCITAMMLGYCIASSTLDVSAPVMNQMLPSLAISAIAMGRPRKPLCVECVINIAWSNLPRISRKFSWALV